MANTLFRNRYGRFVAVVLVVAVAAGLRFVLHGLFRDSFTFVTFFPAVALVAMFLGARAGVAATVLSAVAATYFNIAPNSACAFAMAGNSSGWDCSWSQGSPSVGWPTAWTRCGA